MKKYEYKEIKSSELQKNKTSSESIEPIASAALGFLIHPALYSPIQLIKFLQFFKEEGNQQNENEKISNLTPPRSYGSTK